MQQTFAQDAFFQSTKSTRKRVFLQEMDEVVPWADLLAVIEPHMAKGGKPKGGGPPFACSVMLRIHFMQQWFGLPDPAMEEALHDTPLLREFAGLRLGEHAMPDESTILRFRRLLEDHKLAEGIFAAVRKMLEQRGLMLKEGSIVDATLIAAAPSTKNKDKARDPEMHQSKKGKQWYFGMKAHIAVDDDSGLVHTVISTAGNVADVAKANALLPGKESRAMGDAGYTGVQKRDDANPSVYWRVAMKRAKRKALDTTKKGSLGYLCDKLETLKAQIRATVEHPFRVLKCQFGYRKVRYKGLEKNAQQLNTLFALGNLWMARHKLLRLQGQARPA